MYRWQTIGPLRCGPSFSSESPFWKEARGGRRTRTGGRRSVALAPDPQLAQHVDDFLAAQLSPRTRETYAVDLALFLTWLRDRRVHPRDAARPDIDRYRNWLAEPVDPDGRPAADGRPRYTASSVARKLSAVRAFYSYLAERRVVSGSPAVGVRGPRVRREPRGRAITAGAAAAGGRG